MAIYNGKDPKPFMFVDINYHDLIELNLEMLIELVKNSEKVEDDDMTEVLASLQLAQYYYTKFQES